MPVLCYLLGVPGAGKSTLFGEALAEFLPEARRSPILHTVYRADPLGPALFMQVGVERAVFSGTDTLPMNGQGPALAFLEKQPWPLVLAEGDRLANDKFFKAMQAAGYSLKLFWLDTPLELAAERRRIRGSRQDPSWVKGRITKVAGLVSRWPVTRLDGSLSPSTLSCYLKDGLELVALCPRLKASGSSSSSRPTAVTRMDR